MKHLILLLALALPAAAQTLTNTNLDGVTNATINGKLDDDAVASRAAMSLGTAATGYLPTSYSLELDGVNYVADVAGSASSDITIQHVVSGTGSTVISVTCPARAIVVTAGSTATSTTVAAEVNANGPASALITATALGYGTDLFKATAQTALRDPVSRFGGPNNVVQLNSQGNLQLQDGTISGDGLANGPGNINLQNGARLWMLNAANSSGGSMFYNKDHGADGGEVQFNSDHRIAICMGWYGALQLGLATDASTNKQYVYLNSRGPSTASITSTDSLPLYFQPTRWTGSSVVTKAGSIQAVADGITGDAFLDFSIRAAQPNGYGADGTRPLDMRLSNTGLWEAGKAPAFDTLTASSDVFTQTCSIYKAIQIAKFTLNSAASLAITGAANGQRGVIYITQGTAGTRTLALPTSSVKATDFALSTTSGLIDRLEWECDGSSYYWTITKGLLTSLDSDADAYLVRQGGGAITATTTEQLAVNALVLGLKSGTLWGKTVAAYPFIGATGGPQGENLKANTYDITWAGGGHTFASATGVTGNGSTAYGNTGINLNTLSRQNNVAGFAYALTSSPTDNGYFFGATDANGRFGMYRSGTAIHLTGPNDQGAGQIGATDSVFATDMAIWRDTSSTKGSAKAGTTYYPTSQASTAAPNGNIFLLARSNTGTPAGYSNASLGFFWVGDSLTTAEYAELRGYCAAYQTALGRANP